MVNLKDIVHKAITGAQKQLSDHTSSQSAPSTALAAEISRKISFVDAKNLGIARDKQSEFAEQATAIVTDDKFLDELQDSVGKPLKDESEEEFVRRAKQKMRELLNSKLK